MSILETYFAVTDILCPTVLKKPLCPFRVSGADSSAVYVRHNNVFFYGYHPPCRYVYAVMTSVFCNGCRPQTGSPGLSIRYLKSGRHIVPSAFYTIGKSYSRQWILMTNTILLCIVAGPGFCTPCTTLLRSIPKLRKKRLASANNLPVYASEIARIPRVVNVLLPPGKVH